MTIYLVQKQDWEDIDYIGTYGNVEDVTKAYIAQSKEGDVWGVFHIEPDLSTTHRTLHHRVTWNESKHIHQHEFSWEEEMLTAVDPVGEVFHIEERG